MVLEISVSLDLLDNANATNSIQRAAFKLRAPFAYETFVQKASKVFPEVNSFALVEEEPAFCMTPITYQNFGPLLQKAVDKQKGANTLLEVNVRAWVSGVQEVTQKKPQVLEQSGTVQSSQPPLQSRKRFGNDEDYNYVAYPSFVHGQTVGDRPVWSHGGEHGWSNWHTPQHPHELQHHHPRHNLYHHQPPRHPPPPHDLHHPPHGPRGPPFGHFHGRHSWGAPHHGPKGLGTRGPVGPHSRDRKIKKQERRAVARFVKHVTMEDENVVEANSSFTKIWRVRNDTQQAWVSGCEITHIGGESMLPEGQEPVKLGSLGPGCEGDITVRLQAPAKPGRYKSFWRLREPNGKRFGQRLWCEIVVAGEDDSCSSDSSSSSSSSSDSHGVARKKHKARHERREREEERTLRRLKRRQRKLQRKALKMRKKLGRIERIIVKVNTKIAAIETGPQENIQHPNISVAKPKENVQKADPVDLTQAFQQVAINDIPQAHAVDSLPAYQRLTEMGFGKEHIDQAIVECNGDFEKSLRKLTKQ